MKTFTLTPIAAAILLSCIASAAHAGGMASTNLVAYCDPEEMVPGCPGYHPPGPPTPPSVFAKAIKGNGDTATVFDNLGSTVTVPAVGRGPDGKPIPTSSWIVDLGNYIWDGVAKVFFGGGRDMGDFACTSCLTQSYVPGQTPPGEWSRFMYAVVNPTLWPALGPGPYNQGQWRPQDALAICDGTNCVVLTWHAGGGSAGWWPDPSTGKPVVKPDKQKYKNDPNDQWNGSPAEIRLLNQVPVDYFNRWLGPGSQIPIINMEGSLCCVTAEPPREVHSDIVANAGGGGGGGDSCVHVDSRLPDGRRAGDIKVGDTIQLGDEVNLDTKVGVVTFSKAAMQRGYRITTQSGISLLCSDTAPICTDEGFIKAPELLGKKVAVRVDDDHNLVTRYELVEVVAEVGMLEVQHITVGDRAFWAGAEHGRYILHHNKFVDLEG